MEEFLEIFYLVNDIVVRPDLASAKIIFFVALVNEVLALIPYTVILASQLFFLTDAVTIPLLAKLLVFVSVPAALGSTIGSLAQYWLAYAGGKPLVQSYHQYLKFSWDDIEGLSSRFKGVWYDEIIFLILRSVPFIPSFPLTLVAGFFRMRFWPYMVLTFVGLTIRMMFTLIIVGIGVGGLSGLMFMLYNG
jgi:membrane protein YqaA with SNARE-associated domain